MQIAEDIRRQREDGGGAPSDAETAKVARAPGVKEFVDAVWPALTATGLLARLYDDPAFLARCAPSFTEDERLLAPAASALASSVQRGLLGKLSVEKADGGHVFGSTLVSDALQQAGFRMTPQGLRLRPSP